MSLRLLIHVVDTLNLAVNLFGVHHQQRRRARINITVHTTEAFLGIVSLVI